MSRSIHTTFSKNIFGLTKKQLEEQFNDPNSDLAILAKKSSIKTSVVKERKNKRQQHDPLLEFSKQSKKN